MKLRARISLLLITVLLLRAGSGWAQNIVQAVSGPTFEARPLTAEEKALLDQPPVVAKLAPDAPGHVMSRLRAECLAVVDGWPWRPMFHQLGISGAETHFDHPDELFAVLSDAAAVMGGAEGDRVKLFLKQRLAESPPYAVQGFDRALGQTRERYDVPERLRAKGRTAAKDAWGVHAFIRYLDSTADKEALAQHWPAIRTRMEELLTKDYVLDPRKPVFAKDETARLNGDLAGLYATMHLAQRAGDAATATLAKQRCEKLLQLRLDVERVNGAILEPTERATKGLHHARLGRYLHLCPTLMQLLRADGSALQRVRPFREARPTWWLAFGDRMVGGENYTNSPEFPRALFATSAYLEVVPSAELAKWLDVPWCRADLYFIERLTMVVSARQ